MTDENRAFRNALGTFATGITVVTTCAPDQTPCGVTINSFASVSLSPKLVLFSLKNTGGLHDIFTQADGFCINILSHNQEDISNLFAGTKDDKFDHVDWTDHSGPYPLLKNCLATFQCQKTTQIEGGDHSIFLGEVQSFDFEDGSPLLYYNGSYRTL